jgi:prepilin-type processing-associated H-X9-DG protein
VVKLQEIHDGSSNTVLLIEVADSDIGWTEPRDVRMDEMIPPDGDDVGARFASGHKGFVNMLMCDGAVRPYRTAPAYSNPRKVLYSFLTAWGGKPYKGEWLPGENLVTPVADCPAERDADTFGATDVLPHTADRIRADRNYVYCATFQLAWDDFRRLVGGDPQVEGRPSIAAGLNGPAFPRSSLSPASYVARVGAVSEGVHDKIIAEMREKFPGVTPSISDAVGRSEFIAYAYLEKNLPFATRFDRVMEPLVFHGTTGDAKVASFGFKELANASNEPARLKGQVDVLHYESDQEFVIRLSPKTDEIVLAKVRPGATLGETVQAVQKLIDAPPKRVDRSRLEDKDKLLVPRLGFNILRRYGELTGKHLENNGWKGWGIVEANQSVRFLLNESGARLESEAAIAVENGHEPPPPPPPRNFVLDRPFLIYLKERTAEQPYLAIWVANAELMERRE